MTPPRSLCPIATTLALVGDRWTLVLVREMLVGKSRYSEFREIPERIPTNILANRLASMEADGLIEKTAYQERPTRYAYALTQAGRDLLPVLQAMCTWAGAHRPETWPAPDAFMALKP